MHKQLIISAFKKARENEELKGVKKPSKNYLAKILSDYIFNEKGFSFGERSIVNYYTEALKLVNDDDINISQLKVVLGFCKYLGYKNYEDYIFKNSQGVNNATEGVTYLFDNNEGKSNITIEPRNKKMFFFV